MSRFSDLQALVRDEYTIGQDPASEQLVRTMPPVGADIVITLPWKVGSSPMSDSLVGSPPVANAADRASVADTSL